MDEFGKDLAIAMVSVLAAKVLDEAVEALKRSLKKKTSRKAGKHAKRS